MYCELSNILFVFPYFIEISKNNILISRCTCCYRQSGVLNHYATATLILRDYYMTFSISALLLARDSHIKPDSEAGGLIWVEGWYQGRYGKFHVIIFLSHILHWPFPCIDFYIAKKIFELTNCENKSLRELSLFNFESGFKNIPNNVDLYNDVRNCL
jgi:hypothetical protein